MKTVTVARGLYELILKTATVSRGRYEMREKVTMVSRGRCVLILHTSTDVCKLRKRVLHTIIDVMLQTMTVACGLYGCVIKCVTVSRGLDGRNTEDGDGVAWPLCNETEDDDRLCFAWARWIGAEDDD